MSPNEQMYQDALNVFIQNEWEIKYNTGHTTMLEKTVLDMPDYLAVILSILFGIIGTYFVLKRKKTHTVSLSLREDGLLQVTGKQVAKVVQNSTELFTIAEIKTGMSGGTLYTISIIATVVFFVASSAGA